METRTRRPQTRTFGRPAHAGSTGRPFGRPAFANSYSSRSSGGRTGFRAPQRGGARGGRGGGRMDNIHPSKFVNKATITEQTEHFVPEHAFTDFAIEESLKQNIIKKGY